MQIAKCSESKGLFVLLDPRKGQIIDATTAPWENPSMPSNFFWVRKVVNNVVVKTGPIC